MDDTYESVRAKIEEKMERARHQSKQPDIACSITEGAETDVMCTTGTRYIVICDCIDDPPSPDFVEFANTNRVAVWCIDSQKSQKIIEYLELDMDSDVCPLIYDVNTDTAISIGQPYSSVKWRIGNADRR
jgi:hypothetical protein